MLFGTTCFLPLIIIIINFHQYINININANMKSFASGAFQLIRRVVECFPISALAACVPSSY